MTDTNFRGPVNNLGAMEDSPANVLPTDGPSYSYQGHVFANLRGGAFNKDGIGNARVPAYLDNPGPVLVDNIPTATGTTSIVAAAVGATSGTALTLVTVAPGNTTAGSPSIAPGMPFIPFGGTTPQNVLALDFGFTTGTTTAGNSTIVVVDNTLFYVGQWLAVAGAGNAAKTLSQLTQVASIVAGNTTGITVSPSPLGSLTNAPIGSANLWNQFLPPATQFGPGASAANAESLSLASGLFRLFNPLQAISRNIQIASITSVGGAVTIRGFDVHSQAMSETLTVAAGTATLVGKKAFKYIASITPAFTDTTGTLSVGVGNVFGLPFRMDRYEYLQYCWAGINQANQTGFVAADLTSPALATSGDVRGTINVGTITGGSAADGVKRLWIAQILPLWNNINGTPLNTVPVLGQTQFSN